MRCGGASRLTLDTALRQGIELLNDAGIPVPRLTAEVLLCHALHCEKSYLYAHPESVLSDNEWLHYGRYLHERLEGKPTQYITKRQEFYGRDFRVSPAVLIPRPETEHLVENAVQHLSPGARIVDVGCGSGAIAVTVALELKTPTFGCDVSAEALEVARHNARVLEAPVTFIRADLLTCFADRTFDAVLSNPPYVPLAQRESLQREVRDYEPHVALFGGPSGNEMYEMIFAQASRVLKPGGWLMLELGFGSLDAVLAMAREDWRDVATSDDLAGIPRVLTARNGG
jgi:release factor glutamine methyltransferase